MKTMKTNSALYIDSEIGKLEKVMVHTPGREIEAMTPDTAEQVLYNDIIPLDVVLGEHDQLKKILSQVCQVYEVTDLLGDVLKKQEAREQLINAVAAFRSISHRRDDLMALSREDLIKNLICGFNVQKNSLTQYLSPRVFDIPPLPNLYFTRDSAMAYRNGVIPGAMAHKVRLLESLLMRTIFAYHPDFRGSEIFFDGVYERKDSVTIEGGDFLVVAKNILIIGISQRTTTRAIDQIARRLSRRFKEKLTVFSVLLPPERATIHLDMIFNVIGRDRALVYEPYILGPDRLDVIRMDIEPDGKSSLQREEGLLEGLSQVGIHLEPVLCGGEDPVFQQREQWMSGNNFFAFAPGKVIGYSCNRRTFEALDKGGFSIKKAADFISGKDKVENYEKLAIYIEAVELARGGGGIRCMTMPLKRQPYQWT